MNIQRLRNLTTQRLHTEMDHVHEDIEYLTKIGVMTHMLPNMIAALTPWLKEKITEEKFWDGKFDKNHVGDIAILPMSDEEQKQVISRYSELPHPFSGR